MVLFLQRDRHSIVFPEIYVLKVISCELRYSKMKFRQLIASMIDPGQNSRIMFSCIPRVIVSRFLLCSKIPLGIFNLF